MYRLAENIITLPKLLNSWITGMEKFEVIEQFHFNQYDYFIIDYTFYYLYESSSSGYFYLKDLQDNIQNAFNVQNIELPYLRKRLCHIKSQNLMLKIEECDVVFANLFTSLVIKSTERLKEDGEPMETSVQHDVTPDVDERDDMIELTFNNDLLELFKRSEQMIATF